jgi:hypothetical protein
VNKQTKLKFVAWVRDRTKPTERPPLVGEASANFCSYRVPRDQRDRSLRRILGFLGRSRYCFFQVAPQLYSRSWVDPVPDPILLRKPGRAGNRTRTSGSLARNSDHYTTQAVKCHVVSKMKQLLLPWVESPVSGRKFGHINILLFSQD